MSTIGTDPLASLLHEHEDSVINALTVVEDHRLAELKRAARRLADLCESEKQDRAEDELHASPRGFPITDIEEK